MESVLCSVDNKDGRCISRNKNGIFYVIYKSMQKVRVFLAQTGILAAYPEKFAS